MEQILHHLGSLKPCKHWDKLPTSTGAGFQPSTVSLFFIFDPTWGNDQFDCCVFQCPAAIQVSQSIAPQISDFWLFLFFSFWPAAGWRSQSPPSYSIAPQISDFWLFRFFSFCRPPAGGPKVHPPIL